MLRTRSVPHDQGVKLTPLLSAYRGMLNRMIEDIWNAIVWKSVPARKSWQDNSSRPMKQTRLLPIVRMEGQFKSEIRSKYIQDWAYAAHWVDSAENAAFSIVKSWKRNYSEGDRTKTCPRAKRLFARVKQSLLKIEQDKLRITIKPREYVWIDLSRRWFGLPYEFSPEGLGEPIVTPDMIHLPIFSLEATPSNVPDVIGWDSNFGSFDGFSPDTGWVKVDTRALFEVHGNSSSKMGSIMRRFGRSVKGRRLRQKYRHREFNRAKKHQIEIARVIRNSSRRIGMEALRKDKMLKGRNFNVRLANTDWRGIAILAGERVEKVSPEWTSKTCSRCGWRNKDLKGAKVFECMRCGCRIDRQLNACIGVYERMEGVPHDKRWWDKTVLPALVGGYFQTGAETRAADELVRSLNETVKPQVKYDYDRHADAYLPKSSRLKPV